MSREVSRMEMMPTGMLMKKIQRQVKLSVIHPPRVGTNRGSRDHGDAVDGKSHATLRRRKRVGEYGLLAGLQPAASGALHHAANDERCQIRGQAAEERADGEQSHAAHVEILAAHDRRQPSAEGSTMALETR